MPAAARRGARGGGAWEVAQPGSAEPRHGGKLGTTPAGARYFDRVRRSSGTADGGRDQPRGSIEQHASTAPARHRARQGGDVG